MAETLLETLESTRRRERLEEGSRVRGALAELLALLREVAPHLAPSQGALRIARLDPHARPMSWLRATVDTHALEELMSFERDGSMSFRLGLRLGDNTPEARTAFLQLRYSVPERRVRVGGTGWLEPNAEELLPVLQQGFEAVVASWYRRGRALSGKKPKMSKLGS